MIEPTSPYTGQTGSLFSPLSGRSLTECKVVGYREGRAFLLVALPENMLKGFVELLDGLRSLFAVADIKVRSKRAETRVLDNSRKLKLEREQSADFEQLACSIFDDLVSGGMQKRPAIAATNREIKKRGRRSDGQTVEGILRHHGKLKAVKLQ